MSYPFNIDMDKIKFCKERMPLKDFLLKYLSETDCNPIGQRPNIPEGPGNAKNVGIIQSIMLGIDIGQITLVNVDEDENTPWKWESVDGGHRKRAIKAFFEGKFKVNGKYFSEFSQEEKEQFLNYEIGLTLYEPLPSYIKGYIFRTINETTDVNHQEMLNSYGDLEIANAVRFTVRAFGYRGETVLPHDLFEQTAGGNFKWLADKHNNDRLKLEEFVTRYYYRYYDGGDIGPREDNKLDSMFQNDNLDVPKLKKQVDVLLNYLLNMAKARKSLYGSGLSKGEMNTLANLYLWIETNYGNCNVTDPLEFYQAFSDVYSDYWHDPKLKHQETMDEKLRDEIGENDVAAITTLFKSYVKASNHSYKKQEQLMKWITTDFNPLDYIIVKDKTRAFPRWMKEFALSQQNFKCLIDKLPLKWEDAEAGHIIAHAEGGKTTMENCAMIRKIHNQKMGTMSVTEYAEVYNTQ